MSNQHQDRNHIIKSGFLQRYKTTFYFLKGWKTAHIILYSDSTLFYYSERGASKPDGSVELRATKNFIAVGPYTRNIPNRPELPQYSDERHIIALPKTASRTAEIVWLLCQDDAELNSWMEAICSTLPPPPQQNHPMPSAPLSPGAAVAPGTPRPPPYSSKDGSAAPGGTDQSGPAAKGNPPNKNNPAAEQSNHPGAAVPAATGSNPQGVSNNTTVVVQSGGDQGRSDGLVTGMVLGGVIGMSLAPPWGWGFGGGWGYSGWGDYEFAPDMSTTTVINNTIVENNYNSEDITTNNEVNYADQGFQGTGYEQSSPQVFYDDLAGQGYDQVYDQGYDDTQFDFGGDNDFGGGFDF